MILTFKNTRAVIVAEKELRLNDIKYEVIPTPRHISSECGMCLRVKDEDLEKAKACATNILGFYQEEK